MEGQVRKCRAWKLVFIKANGVEIKASFIAKGEFEQCIKG